MSEIISSQNKILNQQENGFVPQGLAQLIEISKIFSKSKLVPTYFQNQPENCFIALQMAYRLKIDPFMALQNIFIIKDKPAISSQLSISLVNSSGYLKNGIRFKTTGKDDTLAVTAYGHTLDDSEISYTVDMSMARKEGWVAKNPKYLSLPTLMLSYRAAAFLIRLHFPELLMGLHTEHEIQDEKINVDLDNSMVFEKIAQIQDEKINEVGGLNA